MAYMKQPSQKALPGEEELERNVSGNVRMFMALRNIGQAELGAILGINQTAVSRKLANKRPWSLHEIRLVAEYFDLAPDLLLDDPEVVARSR